MSVLRKKIQLSIEEYLEGEQHSATKHEYVLVSQNKREVSVYRRTNDDWDREIYSNDEAVAFRSVYLSITLAAIYEGVPDA